MAKKITKKFHSQQLQVPEIVKTESTASCNG